MERFACLSGRYLSDMFLSPCELAPLAQRVVPSILLFNNHHHLFYCMMFHAINIFFCYFSSRGSWSATICQVEQVEQSTFFLWKCCWLVQHLAKFRRIFSWWSYLLGWQFKVSVFLQVIYDNAEDNSSILKLLRLFKTSFL